MIAVDLRVVGDVLRLVAVMRRAVPAAGEPRLREAGAAQVAAEHERDRPRDVALERQRHQVVHQPEVDVLALRQPERHVGCRLLHRVVHRDLDAALELADVVDVGVDARLVAGAEIGLERAELTDDRVEDAGVALPVAPPLLGAGAVAEQPLEHHARVDLRRQRLRRRRPRDRVGVGAAVAPVAVAEVAGVLDAELQRRQDRVLPVLAGDDADRW